MPVTVPSSTLPPCTSKAPLAGPLLPDDDVMPQTGETSTTESAACTPDVMGVELAAVASVPHRQGSGTIVFNG